MGSKFIRRLGAYGAMLAMLFAQFAIVAYACPVQSTGAPTAMAHVAMHVDADGNPCPGTGGALDPRP